MPVDADEGSVVKPEVMEIGDVRVEINKVAETRTANNEEMLTTKKENDVTSIGSMYFFILLAY